VCVYVFILDPGSDPKKIIPDPQHWLVLYIKVKITHLFILGCSVQYEIVGQIGALGKDGFLEVGFGFRDLGGRGGRGGSDHLLEQPLTERPQVRGAE
jgi:hypothetical protein